MHNALKNSPVGSLWVAADAGGVTKVSWSEIPSEGNVAVEKQVIQELSEYFNKSRQYFDVKINLSDVGTPLQQKIWAQLQRVKSGEVLTYGQLGQKVGTHARAIGGAMGRNPIPIIVPCHRIVGASGKLTGYSGHGGLATKQKLLELEQGWVGK